MSRSITLEALLTAADLLADDPNALRLQLGNALLFCMTAAGNALPLATRGSSTPPAGVTPLFVPLRRRTRSNPFISIGRLDGNDVALVDNSISRFHAMVFEDAHGFSIVDAGSKLGTHVGDVRAPDRGQAPLRLRSRDTIRFGAVSTIFVTTDDAVAMAREQWHAHGSLWVGARR